jgi:UDP-N-acetylmuramate dehydrogenase
VLSATFVFPAGDVAVLKEQMAKALSSRKASQPLHAGSAGCVFKNISFTTDADLQRARDLGDIPGVTEMIASRRVSSGWLIDNLGLKGTTVGGARVSDEHGNFIINTGNATARDVYTLTQTLKQRVFDRSGFALEEEVEFIGF